LGVQVFEERGLGDLGLIGGGISEEIIGGKYLTTPKTGNSLMPSKQWTLSTKKYIMKLSNLYFYEGQI